MSETLWETKLPFWILVNRAFIQRGKFPPGQFLALLKPCLQEMTMDLWEKNEAIMRVSSKEGLDCWRQEVTEMPTGQKKIVEIIPYPMTPKRMLAICFEGMQDTVPYKTQPPDVAAFHIEEIRHLINQGLDVEFPLLSKEIPQGQHRHTK